MNRNWIIAKLIMDKSGILYSTELLLSIIMLVFIIGIMANLSDGLNERMLSEEEFSSLENIAVESSDYLLNNPGSPDNWERDEGLGNGIASSRIIPGLAIKNRQMENGKFYGESNGDEKIMSNAISYNKLVKIKNNYNSLVNENLFNGSVKSSMAIYPLNSEIRPVIMGYDFGEDDDNVNDNDIAVVRRTVKCDFHSSYVLYDFNDFEIPSEDYRKEEYCNHDSHPSLENHENDGNSFWLCKSFRVYRKSLDEWDYYLLSDESVKDSGAYWILESLNRTNDNRERLDQEAIDLNPFLTHDLENSSEELYSIHFNIPKNRIDDFKTVLVAVPKNMTHYLIAEDELRYDYFKVQDVNFVFKAAYR